MRLIDGDILLEQMKHRMDYVGRPSDAVCLVEDAPTIEAKPIKHGKWWQDMFGIFWVCSACNMPTDVKSASKYFKYCPFCGAKMEGEAE